MRMEGKEEDVKLGATKYSERQPLGTSAQTDKDYKEPPPAPLFEPGELSSWSFYRAGIAEFIATFLFLYITILTVMGVSRAPNKCASVGIQGIAWAFGGMIFALVYCTAGISGKKVSSPFAFLAFLLSFWFFLQSLQTNSVYFPSFVTHLILDRPFTVLFSGFFLVCSFVHCRSWITIWVEFFLGTLWKLFVDPSLSLRIYVYFFMLSHI